MDPSAGSIIHFYHFRRWRESGIAYELRDCKYNEPNRSVLSTVYGKRKEYKDRYEFNAATEEFMAVLTMAMLWSHGITQFPC